MENTSIFVFWWENPRLDSDNRIGCYSNPTSGCHSHPPFYYVKDYHCSKSIFKQCSVFAIFNYPCCRDDANVINICLPIKKGKTTVVRKRHTDRIINDSTLNISTTTCL